jgi:1,4-alpha-glucan branching enzyme
VAEHAAHFVSLVGDLLTEYRQQSGKSGVISAAYDTELFGHWWFEGIDWLKQVLRGLAQREEIELTTATRIIENHPPERVMDLPESSWGAGGGHFTWLNVDTEWIWPQIHAAERRMEQLVAEVSEPTDQQQAMLDQAARELLLLESSDWPFLVTTGQAKEYAVQRFTEHVERFNELGDLLEAGGELTVNEEEFVARVGERDNPFPTIDPDEFAARQGDASVHSEGETLAQR